MRIYRIALELVASVVKLSRRIQEHDPDLARQLKRAVVSVPLNMQEGLYSRGGNRLERIDHIVATLWNMAGGPRR